MAEGKVTVQPEIHYFMMIDCGQGNGSVNGKHTVTCSVYGLAYEVIAVTENAPIFMLLLITVDGWSRICGLGLQTEDLREVVDVCLGIRVQDEPRGKPAVAGHGH